MLGKTSKIKNVAAEMMDDRFAIAAPRNGSLFETKDTQDVELDSWKKV